MIEVKHNASGILISGHANYAPSGYDIVCAAVSVLSETLIESIEALTTDEIEYGVSEGYTEIRFKTTLSKQGELLVESFLIGVRSIAHVYDKYVQVHGADGR